MAAQNEIIKVQGTPITVTRILSSDYISLTDMLRAKEGDFFVSDWLRNRNTVEFLGIWEGIHNPSFNYGEFAIIKSFAGLNRYKLSTKQWAEKTNAIGLVSKPGRYGGTFAHKDIAFEFGMWISPEFKLYLIKEFDRLKTEEQKRLSTDWNIQRTLAKVNYRIHTDAIKANLIPATVTKSQANLAYATEADMLNVALFGLTAAEWRASHPDARAHENMRDFAALEQLVVLSNLESINALLIEQGLSQRDRLLSLNQTAIRQMASLVDSPSMKRLVQSERA